MNSKKALTIIGIVLVVLVGAPVVANQILIENQNTSFDIKAEVLEEGENITAGVDAGENLNYGKITKGNNVTKFINISYPRKFTAELVTDGNISDKLEYERHLVGEGREEIPVEFKGSEPGNYTGTLQIRIQTPNNPVGEKWMDIKRRYF